MSTCIVTFYLENGEIVHAVEGVPTEQTLWKTSLLDSLWCPERDGWLLVSEPDQLYFIPDRSVKYILVEKLVVEEMV